MADREISAVTFQSVLKEIGSRHISSKFRIDHLFVLWFLRSYVTESEDIAAEAISGGARDKGIDALAIDDRNKTVVVVQGKYRKVLGDKTEKRSEVTSLAEIAYRLSDPESSKLEKFLKSTDVVVAKRLKEARKRVLEDGYKIWLCFVTRAKVSVDARGDAESFAKQVNADDAKVLMRNYLDGDAPPIPALDLEMEDRAGVRVNGVADRCDDENGIESWVFSMRGDLVAKLYELFDTRLFARNIRGYLGPAKQVNREMVKTLRKEPDRFFYYNNGLTIFCEYAKKETQGGRDVLHVRNRQVINGQQTTRTLAEHPDLAAKATVLVKVITLSKPHDSEHFETLVTEIVRGTNRQTKITQSDLMSNDRKQVELERALRKLQYAYVRKQQSQSETRRTVGSKQYHSITKRDLA